MNNVFILGVSSPIGLSIIRDLGQNGFTTIGIGNQGAIGHASKYCHKCIIRESGPTAVVSQLLTLGGDPQQNFLICISEGDINFINENRIQLSAKFTLLVPENKQMGIVLDKYKTKEIADTLGIESPQSYIIESLSEFDALVEHLSFPVVLKWANPLNVQSILAKAGLTLHKLQYAQNSDELKAFMAVYESIGVYPLIQEYCEGKGLGQFFLCKNGQSFVEFQHERIHEWPPEGGTSTFCRSLPLDMHQQCMDNSRALLSNLDWSGVAMVEYRYSPAKQKYVLMEINGRFWGSSPLSMHAGTAFATNLVKLLGLNQKISQPKLSHYDCLYMIPELKRLFRILFQNNKIEDPNVEFSKRTEVFTLLKALFSFKTRYFVFSFDDPKPFLTDMKNVLKKILG